MILVFYFGKYYSVMKKNNLAKFIFIFITVYFAFSFHSIITKYNGETIPFFSFRLYSKIPNTFERYDILLNDSNSEKPHFLLFNNENLDKLQLKYINNKLHLLGNQFEKTKQIDTTILKKITPLKKGNFVKIKGNYIDAYKNNKYEVVFLKSYKL